MWQAWDYSLDMSLSQLPKILEMCPVPTDNTSQVLNQVQIIPYKPVPFFAQQLTAFQVWLCMGSEGRTPPEQLPIVLQVIT